MAIKGLSKPVCANYTAVGNAVTYRCRAWKSCEMC